MQFWAGPYWFLTIPFGLVALIRLPLTMAGGFLRWLSYCCKRPAPWPVEVLASMGPVLSTTELAQLKVAMAHPRIAMAHPRRL